MQARCFSRPDRLALAVALALGGPAAHAAVDCSVSVNTDDGTGTTPNTLSWAIVIANNGTAPNDPYPAGHPGGGCTGNTITLTTDVTVTGVMKRLIDSSLTLQSDATTRTIKGCANPATDTCYRPLFVKSGTVTIRDLNLANGKAKGGASVWGGAGAGLGGALFIYNGAVTVANVGFTGNVARGGGAGVFGNGGGGMFGSSNYSGGGLFGDAGSATSAVVSGYGFALRIRRVDGKGRSCATQVDLRRRTLDTVGPT